MPQQPFSPTHRLVFTPLAARPRYYVLQLVEDDGGHGGPAYSRAEWETSSEADWECDAHRGWLFHGNPTPGGQPGEVGVEALDYRERALFSLAGVPDALDPEALLTWAWLASRPRQTREEHAQTMDAMNLLVAAGREAVLLHLRAELERARRLGPELDLGDASPAADAEALLGPDWPLWRYVSASDLAEVMAGIE